MPIPAHFQRSHTSRPRYLQALANTLRGNICVAIFSIYVLSNWPLLGFAVSLGALLGSFTAYCTLLERRVEDNSPIPPLHLERDTAVVVPRTITALTVAVAIQTTAFGFTSGDTLLTVLLGITKALSWYFMIRSVSLQI